MIDKTAVICPGAVISPYNVEIGPDVVVGANAVIEENCILERGVRIGANSTVGCQNFDVIQHGDTLFMAKNGGWVRMREYSEIGSGVQVEGATLMKDVTDIGQYVKSITVSSLGMVLRSVQGHLLQACRSSLAM